ncbi:ATP-binding mismatch repair protein [Lobaria immixta]|nr:ATP-binding mismatch repair protein [Lobaria immixta]
MATIKALEGRTVHQIQSGQVIVDLCSVVKELVENSLDAEATSIEVRFKNNGRESIEVLDNGVGISSENYESIALKHYTSKLSNYDDLTSLTTFGFRGEALSSLCALSSLHIITARAHDAPKGTRLDFEISGKLKGTQVVASQRGTTVAVENLFMNLPVRRRELEKNIKREYGKVLSVLQAYACISTNTKFTVSNVMAKGKKVVVFSTKSNPTTRENIANVYGAKALPGLVAMNLNFEMQPSRAPIQGFSAQPDPENKQVHVLGHVSRPIFGEGRQAPDRQVFFVNSRPCALPQVSKVFNEVYKSYNLSQSPFIFANIVLNTNAYDVNVSPDKRTILLHDQGFLLESLKRSLIDLFEKQEQTIPQSHRSAQILPFIKPLSVRRETTNSEDSDGRGGDDISETAELVEEGSTRLSSDEPTGGIRDGRSTSLIEDFLGRDTRERTEPNKSGTDSVNGNGLSKVKQKLVDKLGKGKDILSDDDDNDNDDTQDVTRSDTLKGRLSIPVDDFNNRLAEQQCRTEHIPCESTGLESQSIDTSLDQNQSQTQTLRNPTSSIVQNAFDRMRPRRTAPEMATITIGSRTTTALVGSPLPKRQKISAAPRNAPRSRVISHNSLTRRFGSSMRAFAAPGTQASESANTQSEALDSGEESDARSDEENSENVSRGVRTDSEEQADSQELVDDARKDLDSENETVESSETAQSEDDSIDEILGDEDKKAKEDAKVALLIHQAEANLAMPTPDNVQRAHQILNENRRKDSTTALIQVIEESVDQIEMQIQNLQKVLRKTSKIDNLVVQEPLSDDTSPEERLSLTVSKEDFSRMHIIGQFNLGFILAIRPGNPPITADELFIIDQHASDEKYNFERLQSSTVVQNQRLVHPRTLDLTAIEEEIIIENNATLLKNGFLVSVDESGDFPVGQRCKLISLPMSREVTFDVKDLEELIALLADSPPLSFHDMASTLGFTPGARVMQNTIPRPSKVRRMFAMRACRSSVMVGKALSRGQMERLVRHMSEIDKPWNCPHGRPTMRHLLGLGDWQGWEEDGVESFGQGMADGKEVDWRGFVRAMKGAEEEDGSGGSESGEDGEDENEMNEENEGQGEDE